VRVSSSLVLSCDDCPSLSSLVTASGAQDFYRGRASTLFAGQPPGGRHRTARCVWSAVLRQAHCGRATIVPRNLPALAA